MTDPLDTTDRRPGGRTAASAPRSSTRCAPNSPNAGTKGSLRWKGSRRGPECTAPRSTGAGRDVGGLLADVIGAAGEIDWQPPDTGSLRGDLTALNWEIQESLVVRPSFAVALMAASFHSGQAARAQTQLWSDRYAQREILVERAVERAELPARDLDARSLLIAATAPAYELVLLRTDPDPRLPEQAPRRRRSWRLPRAPSASAGKCSV
ncbi:TetR/AcrR family transcriptional regulator OS=Streptomyces tendae OX=1932 GN=GUR47_22115 PE=4 SV=1 [Streptomyces tendae]